MPKKFSRRRHRERPTPFITGSAFGFSVKLKLPRNFRNPGAFDDPAYLADRGIAALGSSKAEDVELLPGFAGDRMNSWGSRLHRGVVAKVHQLWPARQAALIDAMVTAELRKLIVLLEGDAQKKVERHIALNHPGANLLKVGHHDSAKATTPELVTAVKPAFAVISMASGNSFGLPRLETLGRLAEAGTRVCRTDLDGAITFYLDGHSLTASAAARQ